MEDLQYDLNTVHDKIVLLRPDAINTNRPATLNHQPYNQVLHMIGSLTYHRIQVFRTGLIELCEVARQYNKTSIDIDGVIRMNDDKILKQQLGLSKDVLIKIETDVLGNRNNVANNFMTELQHTWDYEKTITLERVAFLNQKYEEVLKLGNPREGETNEISTIKKCLQLYYNILERQIKIDKDWSHVSVLQYALDVTFELSIYDDIDGKELLQRMKDIDDIIQYLLAKFPPDKIGPPLYFSFKRFQFLGKAYYLLKDRKSHISSLESAKNVWYHLHLLKYYGSNAGIENPLDEGIQIHDNLVVLYCMSDDVEKAILTGNEAIRLIQGFWDDVVGCESNIGCGILDAPWETQLNLATLYRNLGTCARYTTTTTMFLLTILTILILLVIIEGILNNTHYANNITMTQRYHYHHRH